MNWRMIALGLVLVDFGALTAYALLEHGYLGFFSFLLGSSAGWQIGVDLVIACSLAMIWMVADARRSGRSAWPYLLITLVLGSFGPLLYLFVGTLQPTPSRRALVA
ncbi:MAG: DUF2834 domain-containing protein [Nevskiales bacterium]|nr:DUF2834 domain-containing protein [Nevskiales bacterium]